MPYITVDENGLGECVWETKPKLEHGVFTPENYSDKYKELPTGTIRVFLGRQLKHSESPKEILIV